MERRGNTENGLGQDDIIRKFNILKAVPQVTTGSVKAISYGQKLTSGDSKKETINNVSDIQTMYSAKDMLVGFKVTYPSVSETESGNGIWSWVTEKKRMVMNFCLRNLDLVKRKWHSHWQLENTA